MGAIIVLVMLVQECSGSGLLHRGLGTSGRLSLRGGATGQAQAAAAVGATSEDDDWYEEKDPARIWSYEDKKGPWGDDTGGDEWLEDGSDEDFGPEDERVEEGLPSLREPGADGRFEVTLYVYDLAHGMARNSSFGFTDVQPVDAIWQVRALRRGAEVDESHGLPSSCQVHASSQPVQVPCSSSHLNLVQVGVSVHGREWTYCAYQGTHPFCCPRPSTLLPTSCAHLLPGSSSPPPPSQASGTARRRTAFMESRCALCR